MKKILFFGTKEYDKTFFNEYLKDYDSLTIDYVKVNLTNETAKLAYGYDGVCIFVNADCNKLVIEALNNMNVKLILLRCAGYNNVNMKRANELGMTVLNVPSYSPEAVAEHAVTLALAVNRKIHKGYTKIKQNDFSLNGLLGVNFFRKTAGIIGTGKIGGHMAKICHGFGMTVLAYDKFRNPDLEAIVQYVTLEELLKQSDLISLHCPLTEESAHLINSKTIAQMKDGVILINTSRGGLINSDDLIKGIRNKKIGAVGLDVYEEESPLVFEDLSDEILQTSIVARLTSFPNVLITSHQGFFTEEAMREISKTTLENAIDYFSGLNELKNKV